MTPDRAALCKLYNQSTGQLRHVVADIWLQRIQDYVSHLTRELDAASNCVLGRDGEVAELLKDTPYDGFHGNRQMWQWLIDYARSLKRQIAEFDTSLAIVATERDNARTALKHVDSDLQKRTAQLTRALTLVEQLTQERKSYQAGAADIRECHRNQRDTIRDLQDQLRSADQLIGDLRNTGYNEGVEAVAAMLDADRGYDHCILGKAARQLKRPTVTV